MLRTRSKNVTAGGGKTSPPSDPDLRGICGGGAFGRSTGVPGSMEKSFSPRLTPYIEVGRCGAEAPLFYRSHTFTTDAKGWGTRRSARAQIKRRSIPNQGNKGLKYLS